MRDVYSYSVFIVYRITVAVLTGRLGPLSGAYVI